MDLADFIRLSHEEPVLRSLVIGGYAVAAHGHTRATFDVDFLVPRADRDAWFSRLAAAGLKPFGETSAFAQFSPSEDGEDVEMLVRRHRLNLQEPRYRHLFLKYGNRELDETFLRLLRTPTDRDAQS